MQQRAQDTDGDYRFGLGQPFLANSPACVAQAILTRLRLQSGEWFLDKSDGTDFASVIGHNTRGVRDLIIRNRILDTPGVLRISAYTSTLSAARRLSVAATVLTVYGTANLDATL